MSTAPPARGVHVFAPEDVEAAGSHVPVLYVDDDRALYFPGGVGGGATRHPVVPGPSELVALSRRDDIIIVTVARATSRTTGVP
ncbi:putative lipoprotein [Myxococcus hansupus]|uniref:Putative lipoprotein n=1 Tax=Pseudomyxococcus hansupus TaxID=1297742 RepID=A0A0H4WZI5_9BACT|nr:putative lipoprotein [Myxococcus hansupus]